MISTEKFVKNFTMKSPWTGEDMEMFCDYNEYQYGGIALELYCEDEEGFMEPYCTASVCIPGALEDNEIAIKNYSENSGILEILTENGIVNEPHRYVSSGFVTSIPVCTLKERAELQ